MHNDHLRRVHFANIIADSSTQPFIIIMILFFPHIYPIQNNESSRGTRRMYRFLRLFFICHFTFSLLYSTLLFATLPQLRFVIPWRQRSQATIGIGTRSLYESSAFFPCFSIIFYMKLYSIYHSRNMYLNYYVLVITVGRARWPWFASDSSRLLDMWFGCWLNLYRYRINYFLYYCNKILLWTCTRLSVSEFRTTHTTTTELQQNGSNRIVWYQNSIFSLLAAEIN